MIIFLDIPLKSVKQAPQTTLDLGRCLHKNIIGKVDIMLNSVV